MTSSGDPLQRLSAAKLWLTATSAPGLAQRVGGAPYLSAAVYSLPTVVTPAVPTAAADEKWRLYVNPDWLAEADIPQIAAEVAHAAWHLLLDHAGRARSMGVGAAEAAVWAKATDATVAETLAAAGHDVGRAVGPALLGLPAGLAAEQYYAILGRLTARAEPGAAQDGQDAGRRDHGRRSGPDGDVGEDGSGRAAFGGNGPCGSAADGIARAYERPSGEGGLDPTSADATRRLVAIEFRGHVTSRGTQPGEWARWVGDLLEPKVPWQQVLRASVRRAISYVQGNLEPTYTRPSRRHAVSPNVIFPATRRPVVNLAVVVDTSASMDDGLLSQALGEVAAILRSSGLGTRGIAIYSCDAAVHTVTRTLRVNDIRLAGGGGTDMTPGIEAALSGHPRPDIVVVITDGYTPWPALPPGGVGVVIAVLGRQAAALPATPNWATRVECVLE